MNEKKFPDGFYWGAATAAYQVEGGIENCDWAKAARAGRVPVCGIACDHYNRYEEDFDIAKSLGQTAHRFSVEWARIEPKPGEFNKEEIEYYKKVLRALHARGLKPFITLWHFTLPTWFADEGGFERSDAPEIFARYCAYVVSELGELCEHFSTINEPNVYATHGWLYGVWPPFKRASLGWIDVEKGDGTSKQAQPDRSLKHFFEYLKVEKSLVLSHNAAYRAIKAVNPNVKVSIVKHVRVFTANWNPLNKILARLMTYFQTKRYMSRIIDHCDEIGLNYYQWTGFGLKLSTEETDMGWYIRPEGIYYALKTLSQFNKPIYVSEAGLADQEDKYRADYIVRQARGMHKAIEEGVDLRGFMYWSLLDNYEWALGFEKRFGLVEIDYETLERKIRPSAYVYKQICERNAVVE